MKFSSESELLDGARKFNADALAAIYDQYSQGIYAYSLRILGEADLAEECTAETFSRFLNALRSGKFPQDSVKAYLYRIAHNWMTDRFRRQPPPILELIETIPADSQDAPDEVSARHILQSKIRAGLQVLTPEQRQVIVLRYLEEWDFEEIAPVLNKTVGAVKALQHRALEALRLVLYGDED